MSQKLMVQLRPGSYYHKFYENRIFNITGSSGQHTSLVYCEDGHNSSITVPTKDIYKVSVPEVIYEELCKFVAITGNRPTIIYLGNDQLSELVSSLNNQCPGSCDSITTGFEYKLELGDVTYLGFKVISVRKQNYLGLG